MMLGDSEQTLTPACHATMEAEANYAAGQILFLGSRFTDEANSVQPRLDAIQRLSKGFGNTLTSTLWRFVEEAHTDTPMVALVSGHPHPARRKPDFDPADPCRYCVQSPAFTPRFGASSETSLFQTVATYSGRQRGGSLGQREVTLTDLNGDRHVFLFETFFNGHEALTLAVWARPLTLVVPVTSG
jgi:hypothetical protein